MVEKVNYVVGILFIFFIWTIASYLINSQLILPNPLSVFLTIADEITKQIFWMSLVQTLSKVLVVLFSVVFVGVVVGFLVGLNDILYEISRPFILFMQAFPIVTWLALVMFIWGIGWTGPVVVSFLSLLPNAILSTAVGIQTTDKRLIEMAHVYNVRKSRILKDVYLGSIIPQFVSTLQVVIGNVWKVVVVAEYMCGEKGIGVLIAWARQSVSVEKVYAYTIVIIAIGLIVESIVHRLVRRLLKNWELA
ncbi:MAG: ABC transporter permease subunit [Fervidobacterium sp.]